MEKEIIGKVVKVYDRYQSYAKRSEDLKNKIVDITVVSKEDKNKFLGIKFDYTVCEY